MKMRLRPNMSANRPPVTMSDAKYHGVSIDDPLHGGDVGVKVVLDRGKRNRERGEVVGNDQHGDAHGDHAQHGCFVEMLFCRGHPAPCGFSQAVFAHISLTCSTILQS